jgi:hypothetical protein
VALAHGTTMSMAILETWAALPWSDGAQLEDQEAFQMLRVRTKNTMYEITVLDPRSGEVLVRGGTFFPAHTRATLLGASLAGSFLKQRGVYVGFCMEFHTDMGVIVTTRVQQIGAVRDRVSQS